MDIEFDPEKNTKNIEERGIAFDVVLRADWARALVGQDNRNDYGEVRLMAYVPIEHRLHVVVYVQRRGVRRIISVRKANQREKRRYEKATH